MKKNQKITFVSFSLISLITINGCSSLSSNKKDEPLPVPVSVEQKIETGIVLGVRIIEIKPEKLDSHGKVGLTVDSSGTSEIQGSIDLKTIGSLYRNATKDDTAQEIIIKKDVGETVAITQNTKEIFKVGDRIKVLKRDGKAVVIH